MIDMSLLSAQTMLSVRTVLLLKQAIQVVSRAFSNTIDSFQNGWSQVLQEAAARSGGSSTFHQSIAHTYLSPTQ